MFNVLEKNGIIDVEELMSEYAYNKEIVEKWKYKRETGSNVRTTYNISKKAIADLVALQDFVLESATKLGYDTPGEMNHAELMALTRHDFTIMRTSPKYKKDKDCNDAILEGTGSIEYHLGCDFTQDKDGTLSMYPKKYVNRIIDGYVRMFGEKPNKRIKSPLEENDHPEVDDSDFLDEAGIAKYQSLIGSMQWAISLGRLDIATACMTLSSFRACPRIGHLDRAKRVVSYLSNMSDARICFRTELPDYSDLPGFDYNWDLSIYGDVKEEIPTDAPTPLGNTVQFTHFVDANLYHDLITGRSVTGILHLANQTPINWYTKKQNKVETATYGSEFMAARTTVEQIMDLRLTFRYLGVPITEKSYMFGDNEAVVNSAVRIDSKLHKRHNALSYHRVREAIASKMVGFHHIPGVHNPADILSKHWAYGKVWSLLQPLMFWEGDTADIEHHKNKNKRTRDMMSQSLTVTTAASTRTDGC